MSATDQLLAERYGRGPKQTRRRKIAVTTLAVSLLVAFLSWAIAVNFFSSNQISATTDSFSVTDSYHSTVKFSINLPAHKAVSCDLTASNANFQVVGYRTIYVPAGAGGIRSFETTLNTTELPVSLSVQNCQFR